MFSQQTTISRNNFGTRQGVQTFPDNDCNERKKTYMDCLKKNPRIVECGLTFYSRSKCSALYLDWFKICGK